MRSPRYHFHCLLQIAPSAFHVRSLLCCTKALQLGECCTVCCLEVMGLQVQCKMQGR